ncbi:MAG TPA: phosphocholine cytidylyltransferase family protein [Polyangiaceae bacterium]|nr:phosphocholine cytidylyltransferase family protein [Polyangiaceae bacterium]
MARTTTAVILVAGIGSRLRPLTDDRPKALVDIGGETILARALRILAERGVERVILATGYREDALRRALEGSPLQIEFVSNQDYATTQNSVSLALCAPLLAGRAFFKLDGDVVFEPEVLERLEQREAPLAVAVDRTRTTDAEAMKFTLSDASLGISAFGKDIPLAASAGESIGIERLSAEAAGAVFAELGANQSRGRVDLYYEDVYSELISKGKLEALGVDVGDLRWTEVDDMLDLARARELIAELAR